MINLLSVDVLHLVVDCSTLHFFWRSLEKALASPSNSRIMQLHGSFQDLQQGDSSDSIYMQQTKSLFNKLTTAGHPISLKDFNLYMFHGLRGEFNDLITSLITKAEPLPCADLHSNLLTHEFPHKTPLLHGCHSHSVIFLPVTVATTVANTIALCSPCCWECFCCDLVPRFYTLSW